MNEDLELAIAAGIVPVVVIDDAAAAPQLADALLAGGIATAEVTLRTPAALDAIRAMSTVAGIVVGAGTVIDASQVAEVVAAGAKYVVSPGFSPAVLAACERENVPLIPGAATASEIQVAREAGLRLLKFFPAGASGGARTLKALTEPFADVSFMPTGGIDADSMGEYLRISAVGAVVGTWVAPRQLIADGEFTEIARRVAASVALAKEAR